VYDEWLCNKQFTANINISSGIPRLITLRNSLPITSQSIDREIIVAMNYSEVILKQGD
jgi:hypothetical protein